METKERPVNFINWPAQVNALKVGPTGEIEVIRPLILSKTLNIKNSTGTKELQLVGIQCGSDRG